MSQTDIQITLARALREFGPLWKIDSDCSTVDPLDPTHWAAGAQSVQISLRHRVTGHLKMLGRRGADGPSASFHRGVALQLVEAYDRGNADPIRRYLEDIGVYASTARDTAQFFRRPSVVTPLKAPSWQADGLVETAPSIAAPVPAARVLAGGDATYITSRVSHAAVPKSRSPLVGRPKWPSLSTVASRWRRETPRPALPEASVGPRRQAAAVEGRRRMLTKLRRELEIWQWRRAASRGSDSASPRNE